MQQFTSTARRDGRCWVVQCDQHPGAISQVDTLDGDEAVHAESIAYAADIPPVRVSDAIDIPDLIGQPHKVVRYQWLIH